MGKFSKYFDHTLLKSTATRDNINKLCDEAVEFDFYSVCVNPIWVRRAHNNLIDYEDIKVVSVVGFPFGANESSVLEQEATLSLENGADEIDLVANPGLLMSTYRYDLHEYYENIKVVSDITHKYGKLIKVIIESEMLTESQIKLACRICKEIGVDYVKTSTGYSPCNKPGADVESVKLILNESEDKYKVKASGGIRTLSDANKFINLGVDRLGCSSSVDIIKEFIKRSNT